MLPLLLLAAALLSPAEQVASANERIGVAAMVRCPKPTEGEVVICSRASQRDRFRTPLPFAPEPGDHRIVNALGERAALANMHKWSEPSRVGPGGEYGTTLHMIANAVGQGTFVPIHKQFEGPDIQYGTDH